METNTKIFLIKHTTKKLLSQFYLDFTFYVDVFFEVVFLLFSYICIQYIPHFL